MPRLRTTPRKLQNQPFRPPAPPAVTSGKKRPRRRQRLALRSDTSDYSRNSNPGCEFCPLLAAFNLPGDTNETTFAEDIADPEVLRAWLLELVEQVAWRLRQHELKGRTV